ncbi:hypothetical protein DJ568_14840 [Mucilaginibacter hurinus]|uniref:RloB domain-containing protein n=1 Tax=Mucilaginibacter hurinus TaxID=2201324 RepID=A0A367GLE6_9SPHI|nr:RloB family protein [Mucilaginibacter hurinus]RCH54150.1 hypothetical protein DJ568_14840 [Mucilaginibacter hurinus]
MSRSKSREYKKGKPHRDFRKFIIVAEGDREDEYFSFFKRLSLRIDIQIVPREGGKSACKYFLDRINDYDYKYGIEKEDYVWFVLDVDRWPKREIYNLYVACQENSNYHIGMSNPCFEVWLCYHFLKVLPDDISSGKNFKTYLPEVVKGGYNRDVFASLIATASKNANTADNDKDNYFPALRITKLYSLANQLLHFLGNNW